MHTKICKLINYKCMHVQIAQNAKSTEDNWAFMQAQPISVNTDFISHASSTDAEILNQTTTADNNLQFLKNVSRTRTYSSSR